MRRGVDFGILPGGMHEVALYTRGRDRIYSRPGFIKYALQHGVCLLPALTSGRATSTRICGRRSTVRSVNLRCRASGSSYRSSGARAGGARCCRATTSRLHTVVAEPVRLPRIENPTRADVEQWHGAYVAALTRLYDTHKAQWVPRPRARFVLKFYCAGPARLAAAARAAGPSTGKQKAARRPTSLSP